MAKMFDGKKVYERESFSYEQAKIAQRGRPLVYVGKGQS